MIVTRGVQSSLQSTENKEPSSIKDCRERGTYAQGVYPTQYTSRMGTANVNQKNKFEIEVNVPFNKLAQNFTRLLSIYTENRYSYIIVKSYPWYLDSEIL